MWNRNTIIGISEFSGSEAQPATPTVEPPAPTPEVPPSPAPQSEGKVYTEADLERVRKEEKAKVYSRLEAEKKAAAEAQALAKQAQEEAERAKKAAEEARIAALPVDEQLTARLAQLESDLRAERTKREQIEADLQAQARRAQLNDYKSARLATLRENGVELFEFLVGGENEAAIEESIKIAAAEYQHQSARLRANLEKSPDHQKLLADAEAFRQLQAQATAEVPPAPQAQPQPQPQYFATPPGAISAPTPTAPAPAPGPTTGPTFDNSMVAQLTSPDAIRSGEYAANRPKLLAYIRQNGQVPPAAVPPRAPTMDAPAAPPPPAPQPTQQSVPHSAQPNGVQQPTGLPTPPAAPPQMVQPDPARDAAVKSVHRALVDPARAAAAGAAGVKSGGIRQHSEYQVNQNHQPPSVETIASGGHPMIRG